MKLLLIPLLPVFAALAIAAPGTLGEGDSYAWASNMGWLELTPGRPVTGDGIVVTDTHLSGYAWSDSTGWINFGDGSPADSIRYGNSDGADSGVNQDGTGNLSGLAWSANLGWINFGWWTATPSNPNRPRFDLYSGGFTGYAWCATSGWINLGSGLLKTDTVCVTDADSDGISDTWERERTAARNGGDSTPDLTVLTATGDSDGDGASDRQEYAADTNPFDAGDKLSILQATPGAGGTALIWTSRPTRQYRIQQSPLLQNWVSGSLLTPDAGPTTTRTAAHSAAAQRYFRVEAVVPLLKQPAAGQ